MKWIIQNNIYEEEGFESLLRALEACNCEVVHVKVVPFEGRLEAIDGKLPSSEDDAIVLGSYTLARVAKQMKWRPGAFLNNLDFTIQHAHWGDLMLNADAKIYEFGHIPFQKYPFFLRPVHDTKALAGRVFDWGEYSNWGDSISLHEDREDYRETKLRLAEGGLTMETPVMVCSKKEIYNETRIYIVDHLIATSSRYKIGTIKRYADEHETEPRILEFAKECDKLWRPDTCYVMDVADTPKGLKIIEINNINSAGFYKGNMNKLVQALEDWA